MRCAVPLAALISLIPGLVGPPLAGAEALSPGAPLEARTLARVPGVRQLVPGLHSVVEPETPWLALGEGHEIVRLGLDALGLVRERVRLGDGRTTTGIASDGRQLLRLSGGRLERWRDGVRGLPDDPDDYLGIWERVPLGEGVPWRVQDLWAGHRTLHGFATERRTYLYLQSGALVQLTSSGPVRLGRFAPPTGFALHGSGTLISLADGSLLFLDATAGETDRMRWKIPVHPDTMLVAGDPERQVMVSRSGELSAILRSSFANPRFLRLDHSRRYRRLVWLPAEPGLPLANPSRFATLDDQGEIRIWDLDRHDGVPAASIRVPGAHLLVAGREPCTGAGAYDLLVATRDGEVSGLRRGAPHFHPEVP